MMGSSGSSAGSLVKAIQSGLVIQLASGSAWRDVDKSLGRVAPAAVKAPACWKKPRRVILLITKMIYINNLRYIGSPSYMKRIYRIYSKAY